MNLKLLKDSLDALYAALELFAALDTQKDNLWTDVYLRQIEDMRDITDDLLSKGEDPQLVDFFINHIIQTLLNSFEEQMLAMYYQPGHKPLIKEINHENIAHFTRLIAAVRQRIVDSSKEAKASKAYEKALELHVLQIVRDIKSAISVSARNKLQQSSDQTPQTPPTTRRNTAEDIVKSTSVMIKPRLGRSDPLLRSKAQFFHHDHSRIRRSSAPISKSAYPSFPRKRESP